MKYLIYTLIISAVCWILSEVMEITSGSRTSITLWLTSAFHFFIAFGIWGAYSGQDHKKSSLSLVAVVMVSVGYLILVYPPIAVSLTPTMTITEFMEVNVPFKFAALLAVLGTILFGVSILRHKSYAAWIGIALVVCPVIFSAVMILGGFEQIAAIANLVESGALIAISLRVLSSEPVDA